MPKNTLKVKGKRKKLLDNYLSGVIAQDIYEEMEVDLQRKQTELNAQRQMLESQLESEGSLQIRLKDFKRALTQNQVLDEFDRGIFESIIEKVIVGGFDENGNIDPYKLTFVYKTGFENEIGNTKERFENRAHNIGSDTLEVCSYIIDEVEETVVLMSRVARK